MGVQNEFKDSDVVILPVPYEGTISYRGGTREGPHAILTASRQVEFFDLEFGKEVVFDIKLHTTDELEPDCDSPYKTIKRVEEAVGEILKNKKFPIVFGGEHSITLGEVFAIKKKYQNLSVLQVDAHADLRESYEGSKYNHACVMRRVREDAKIDTVVQVGIRAIDKSEYDYIKNKNIKNDIYFGRKFDSNKIVERLSENVFITIDLDCFDPSIIPAVGTPEPGGLLWEEVIGLLRTVAKKRRIVGFDIVELAPISGQVVSEFLAAKLTYKLLGYSFLLKRLRCVLK